MNGKRSVKRNEAKDPVAKAKRDRADADAATEAVSDASMGAVLFALHLTGRKV